jgi:hypothetical protein
MPAEDAKPELEPVAESETLRQLRERQTAENRSTYRRNPIDAMIPRLSFLAGRGGGPGNPAPLPPDSPKWRPTHTDCDCKPGKPAEEVAE